MKAQAGPGFSFLITRLLTDGPLSHSLVHELQSTRKGKKRHISNLLSVLSHQGPCWPLQRTGCLYGRTGLNLLSFPNHLRQPILVQTGSFSQKRKKMGEGAEGEKTMRENSWIKDTGFITITKQKHKPQIWVPLQPWLRRYNFPNLHLLALLHGNYTPPYRAVKTKWLHCR